MSHDEPKGWDAGLSGLLAAERRNTAVPEGAEDRVWQSVAVGMGAVGAGGSGGADTGERASGAHRAASGGSLAARVASPFGTAVVYGLGVLTGIVGSVAVMRSTVDRVPSAARAPVAEVAEVSRDLSVPALAASLNAMADANVPSAPQATPTVARSRATVDRTLEGERIVLDEARAALGRGDGVAALRATDSHARSYPDGFLAEEREAIAIQALLLVPRYDDARQREAAFERQYPHSMLLQAVRASVQSIP